MHPHTQVKYSLTQMDSSSDKETLHTEFDLTGSELQFTSGDALGIYPQNNPPEVDTLIKALHSTGDQLIAVPMSCYSPKPEGDTIELREALIKYYDLKTIKIDLMKLLVDSVADKEEKKRGNALLKDGVKTIILSYGVINSLLSHILAISVTAIKEECCPDCLPCRV